MVYYGKEYKNLLQRYVVFGIYARVLGKKITRLQIFCSKNLDLVNILPIFAAHRQ